MDREPDKLTNAHGRRPSLAVAAADLAAEARRGILCTLIPEGGFPYGSLVELLPLPDGDPVMFLSRLAEHQHNLAADPRASVVIAPHIFDAHAMAKPRVTLIGRVELVDDRDSVADAYVERHPDAAGDINFPDFLFYRLRVELVRYIAGFGQMGWVKGDSYREAMAGR
jgi:hypothetical protein